MELEEIKVNYSKVLERVDKALNHIGKQRDDLIIVAVTKTHPVDYILDGMKAGIENFGENYVQELKEKHQYFIDNELQSPKLHYIGHLQRNKVKYIAPFIEMIHSVDSIRLAKEINKQALKNDRILEILIQVNVSGERSKFGCKPEELEEIMSNIKELPNIKISGLMTIGSFSNDENIYREEFQLLRRLFEEMQAKFSDIDFKHLSMGMTHDFETAIEEGATIVRIGTAIFGARDYSNKEK